jgi:hypothetical protein
MSDMPGHVWSWACWSRKRADSKLAILQGQRFGEELILTWSKCRLRRFDCQGGVCVARLPCVGQRVVNLNDRSTELFGICGLRFRNLVDRGAVAGGHGLGWSENSIITRYLHRILVNFNLSRCWCAVDHIAGCLRASFGSELLCIIVGRGLIICLAMWLVRVVFLDPVLSRACLSSSERAS